MTMTPPDANALLMGGGSKAFPFDTPGDKVRGEIVDVRTAQATDPGTGKPKFWDNGDPVWQVVVTLQTDLRDPELPDDDGLRTVYLKGGKKRASTEKAAADAVKAAGATQLLVGGTFGLVYTGDGAKTNPAFNAPKEYGATYVPPVAGVDLSAAWDD